MLGFLVACATQKTIPGGYVIGQLPFVRLEPEALALMRTLSGPYAEQYISDYLRPTLRTALKQTSDSLEDIQEGFSNAYRCLMAFFAHYAFARRGRDREEISSMAVAALKRLSSEEEFEKVLELPDGVMIWECFCQVCQERGHKNNEQQNRGLIQGMLELAQEVHRLEPGISIAEWIANSVEETGRIESQFLRIVDIRGVGPKSTSAFLRDVAFLYDLEGQIEPIDRLHILPIDRWVRMVSEYIIPPEDMHKVADWILAGKLTKYTRRANVSAIRFNMGCNYFGGRIAGDPKNFPAAIETLLKNPDAPVPKLGELRLRLD